MTPYLVHHFLEASADRRSEEVFLIHEGRRHSYGEIETAANRIAHLLEELGVRRGDRVGLIEQNNRAYVEGYYGILKAGAVAVSLNTAADGPTLRQSLSDCGAKALLAGKRFSAAVAEAITALPDLEALVAADLEAVGEPPAHIRALPWSAAEQQSATRLDSGTIDLDDAAIVYTSGSTGRPRGATLRHLNICTNTRSIVSYLGLRPADRVLQILPFYYVYGKSLLNTHAAAGGSVVIENRFLFPNTALDTLEKERCTGLSGVPSTFAILLHRSNLAHRKLEDLRYVTQAGGAMSPEHTRRLMEALPGKRIFIMYGATEASARLTYLSPEDLPHKIGSIGRAIPNVEVRVLRDDGTEAAVGEEGEIVARGANIMRGYWGDAEETQAVLGPEGYHTGDIGRRDEEGFLYVVGRKKDMIKAGAHRISAKEIEDAILEYPEIHEAAVIGIPDELLGETIKAFVVFREDSAQARDGLMRFLKKRLPAYKLPAAVEALPALPKNESGKVMKQELRKLQRAAQSQTAPRSEE